MWQPDRRQRIRALLGTFGRVSVDRVTEELGVSRETIRRDLMEMEAEGELRRVRGGAVPLEPAPEPPYAERTGVRLREKRAIAQAAVGLVRPGQVLFLDAGSTTAILAEALALLGGLTVVTNSVDVAAAVAAPESLGRRNRAVLVGGRFSPSPPATFGAAAVNEISRYAADLALVSPFGLDARAGATSYDPDEAEVARAMLARARQTVLLADHSKLGTVSRVSFGAAGDFDRIVVDARAEGSEALARLRAANPAVTVAARG